MLKLEFIKGFLREPNGKPSQKRAVVFIATMLLCLMVWADLFYNSTVDYMLLATVTTVILFGIGAITKLSSETLDKILDKTKTENNEKTE